MTENILRCRRRGRTTWKQDINGTDSTLSTQWTFLVAQHYWNGSKKWRRRLDLRCKKLNWRHNFKHQIRDSQQSKATSSANNLNSNTALWLKDYAHKILPDKHTECQKDYQKMWKLTPWKNILWFSNVFFLPLWLNTWIYFFFLVMYIHFNKRKNKL